MESEQQNRSLLLFKVGPYNFCAPVDRVEGVISPPVITTIPMAPPSIAGTFVFRERAAVVVDMWEKLGVSNNQRDNPGLFIVTSLTSGLVAFKVESVSEIIHAESLKSYKLPFAKIYQLFAKFMLRGNEILLLTDFELLFASGEMAHLMGDLSELLDKRSKDTAAEEVGVAEADVKAGPPPEGKAHELVERANGAKAEEINDVPNKNGGHIADKPKEEARLAGKQPAVKQKRRPSVGADTKKRQVKSPPRHSDRPLEVVGRIDKRSGQMAVMPPQPRRENDSKSYILGGLLFFVILLLAGFYLYPSSDLVDKQAVTPANVRIETGLSAQLPAAPPEAVEDIAVEEDPEASEIKEASTPETPLGQGAENLAKSTVMEEAVPPAIKDTVTSQELLRVETDDFTLTVQRPVKMPEAAETSPVSLPKVESPQPVALPEINTQRDIIHQVVKGDTLWDIAEKYLADPYRYKDLANLSRIRNPHWIYPGDIIHIVIKKGAKPLSLNNMAN